MERPTIALYGISTVAGRYAIGVQPAQPGVNLFACRLRAIASDSFRVIAPVIPPLREAIWAEFGSFGMLAGDVTRQHDDGFEVTLRHDDAERLALNMSITSFSEKLWTTSTDRRAGERIMPRNPRTVIYRPDNWSQPCLIVDYSVSGAAVSAAFQPAVGEMVTIGQVSGEVVRLFDFGFAVQFIDQHDGETLEHLLEAPEAWQQMMRRAPQDRDGMRL